MLGRLEHHRVAGSQRRRQFPHGQHQGRVPWRDRHHHTQRFMARVVEDAGHVVRYDCAFDLVGQSGVVVKVLRQGAQLGQHIDQPLAVVARLDHRQRLDMALQVNGDTPQQFAASAGRHAAPSHRLEGCARGCHGALCVCCAAPRNRRPGLAIGRVERLQPLPTGSVTPDATNQLAVGAQQRCGAARQVRWQTGSIQIRRVGVG